MRGKITKSLQSTPATQIYSPSLHTIICCLLSNTHSSMKSSLSLTELHTAEVEIKECFQKPDGLTGHEQRHKLSISIITPVRPHKTV